MRIEILSRVMIVLKIIGLFALLTGQVTARSAQDAYFENLQSLCGSRFVGEMTFPVDGQDSFKGKRLVAEFLECSDAEIRIPFSVGADRSRTWVVSRSETGLSLKHDHRHEDGSPDAITDYGGEAALKGTALSQAFEADEHTQQLIPEASTNVWNISLNDDFSTLTYHLERHAKPRFTAVLFAQEPEEAEE